MTPAKPSLSDPHLLVVDDDERLRALLTRYLSTNGFRVSAAAHAADARSLMKSIAFDCLILDVMMPGESGLELAKGVRTQSQIPILMLTARGDAADRIAGLELGADDYLPKPFEPRELLLRINALLATLATLFAYNGLNQGLNASNTVIIGYTNNDVPIKGNHALHNSFFTSLSGNILSVPIAFWLMVAFAIVLTIVLRFTPFGYRVRSIGSNPEAAKFSGISIPRVTYQAFLLAGVVAGLAGLLVLIFFQDADPTVGGSDNLLAIAAVIIGGTPMRGGTGTVIGAMVGAVLLSGVIQSGLTYFSISENWTQFALGVVILAAVSVDSVVRAGRRRA